MEPLDILAISAAVAQFIDFGTRLCSQAFQLYKSPSGLTTDEADLTTIANDLAELGQKITSRRALLGQGKPEDGSFEAHLVDICGECTVAAQNLDAAIRKFRPEHFRMKFLFGEQGGKAVNSLMDALRSVRFDASEWHRKLARLRERMMAMTTLVLW